MSGTALSTPKNGTPGHEAPDSLLVAKFREPPIRPPVVVDPLSTLAHSLPIQGLPLFVCHRVGVRAAVTQFPLPDHRLDALNLKTHPWATWGFFRDARLVA